jgi:small subunit ribosomal protein S8
MIIDPISDMFMRIRNANLKLHEKVDVPFSKVKLEIAKILKEERYISDYEIKNIEDQIQSVLRIHLRYASRGKKAILRGIKRVSKPSLRVYKGYANVPRTIGGLGVTIISTPKGLMTDRRARKDKIGGEVIGCVW